MRKVIQIILPDDSSRYFLLDDGSIWTNYIGSGEWFEWRDQYLPPPCRNIQNNSGEVNEI